VRARRLLPVVERPDPITVSSHPAGILFTGEAEDQLTSADRLTGRKIEMLKRNAALLIVGALLVGGAAGAWARGTSSPSSFKADLAVAQAATTNPSTTPADRQALRDQIKKCLQDRRAARQSGSSSTTTPSDSCQALKDKVRSLGGGRVRPGRARALIGRADHGTLDIKDDSGHYVTYTFDKGTVAAGTNGDQVVIDRPDGKSVTVKIDAKTKFRGIGSAAELKEGQNALVVSKGGTATLIAQRDKAADARGPGALSSAGAGDLAA
jgi:hypothetical protein